MTTSTAYTDLLHELKELSLLGSTMSVLGWDEQTYMPAGGAAHRADQFSLLARMWHERFTSPRMGDLLAQAEADLAAAPSADGAADMAVNLRETRRDYDRATKLPAKLVEELAHTTSMGQQAWAQARKDNRFGDFQSWLEKILSLKQQEAQCIGAASGEPYDALLDEYEPGLTAAELRTSFADLRETLVQIVGAIRESGRTPRLDILSRHYPAAQQETLARTAAAAFGFNFDDGRLDTSVHPFCSFVGPGDTRITTRYNESDIGDAFFSVLHETGHGLYDQGLPAEHYGTPLGSYVSLGIHESQSRLWENLVGRSPAFWQWMWPQFKAAFPDALADVTEEEWMFAINSVQPSLIRTESDEITYNLHIILRFELEQALLSGELPVADLPGAWNEAMDKFLGVQPPTDANGCLQDIHWSGGSFGYFPTYTLGNLVSAQLFEAARTAIPDLEAGIARGEFSPLLKWLQKNIHTHGKRYSPAELVQRATGKELSADALQRHLWQKAETYYWVRQ